METGQYPFPVGTHGGPRTFRNQRRRTQCPLRVISRHHGPLKPCPLYPRKRTSPDVR